MGDIGNRRREERIMMRVEREAVEGRLLVEDKRAFRLISVGLQSTMLYDILRQYA